MGLLQQRRWIVAGSLHLLLVGLWSTALSAGEVHFQVVDGKLCVQGHLKGPAKSVPATVVIDLGVPVPLLVHNQAGKLLGVSNSTPTEVRLGDAALELPAIVTDISVLDDLSREHATELGEVPAMAVVGLPAFKDQLVQLDVEHGSLRLGSTDDWAAAVQPDRVPASQPSDPRQVELPYEQDSGGYWLAGLIPADFRIRVRFCTSSADTIIDSTTADLGGSAAGEIGSVLIGAVNVAQFVPLRPEDLSAGNASRPDLILGTNLLTSFRVTIHPGLRRMHFEQTHSPALALYERAYFAARAKQDAAGVEAFLQAHASSRLAPDAADTLLALRLGETPTDRDAILRAMRHRAAATAENRRATTMIGLADTLLAATREDADDLAMDALNIGLESAGTDRDGVAAHQIHARMGFIALRRNDLLEARRQLLSAAFGLPRDAKVNLWLGELYEKSGKPTRAWSRYVQSALDREPPVDAIVALDRLQKDSTFRRTLGPSNAAELLEGRVTEFHPASRAADDAAVHGVSQPVSLVELFTCIDDSKSLAPELAFAGLQEFFEDTDVAFIQYHLLSPAADPLTAEVSHARAAVYHVATAPAALFDGQSNITQGGGEGDAPALFNLYTSASRRTTAEAQAWRITGDLHFAAGAIEGRLAVDGPAADDALRLHAVVCTPTMIVPGGNGSMIHRHVARGRLSPAEGFAIAATAGKRSYDVHLVEGQLAALLEGTLATAERQHDLRFLLRPTWFDAATCTVVAFIQDSRSLHVLAASSMQPAQGGVRP
jgi:hypothetical protein